MIKQTRHIVIILCISVLAFVLPYVYSLAFFPAYKLIMVNYSSSKEDFLIHTRSNNVSQFSDSKNRAISKEEYYISLPYLFSKVLSFKGLFTDSITGIKENLADVQANIYFEQLFKEKYYIPQPVNVPIFEPSITPSYYKLNDLFMRYKNNIELYDAWTKDVNIGLSELVTQRLKESGFVFPTQKIFGDYQLKKNYHLGYYLLDNKRHLFRIKFYNLNPSVEVIKLPLGLSIKHIQVTTPLNKEIVGIIISENDEIYLHLGVSNSIVKLDIENYNPKEDNISIFGSPQFKTFKIGNKKYETVYIINDDYKIIKTYYFEKSPEKFKRFELGESLLFPFILNISTDKGTIKNPELEFNWHYGKIILHIVFLLLYFSIKRKKSTKGDFLIIALTGIYGFISVLFIRQV